MKLKVFKSSQIIILSSSKISFINRFHWISSFVGNISITIPYLTTLHLSSHSHSVHKKNQILANHHFSVRMKTKILGVHSSVFTSLILTIACNLWNVDSRWVSFYSIPSNNIIFQWFYLHHNQLNQVNENSVWIQGTLLIQIKSSP